MKLQRLDKNLQSVGDGGDHVLERFVIVSMGHDGVRFGITDTQQPFHERHKNQWNVLNTDISVTRGTKIWD